MPAQWWSARRKLRYQRARGTDALCERGVLGRVNAIESGGKYGDGGAAAGECPFVSRRVDADGKPAGHREARASEPGRELARRGATGGRGTTRAHQGELCRRERLDRALYVERRRRPAALQEERRIVR